MSSTLMETRTELVFKDFAVPIRKRFMEMAAGKLFVVDSTREELWNNYLAGFPEGTNLTFRKRTEHDCSCCRHFIYAIGNVVSIQDGVMGTIWDVTGLPDTYQAVADAMAAYIRSRKVEDVYFTKFPQAGQEKSIEEKDGNIITWNHFSATVPAKFVCSDPCTKQGEARTAVQILQRAVEELNPAAVATVLELIDDNAIYRGTEHRATVAAFQQAQTKLRGKKALFFWESLDNKAAVHIRNSAIGSLLIDLSDGKDEEQAVKSFEAKVAPTNYKRPTAVYTKAMAEAAMKTLKELDLESALERRHAQLGDVHFSSVLWVDNSVQGKLKGGIEGLIMGAAKPAAFDPKTAKPIKIDEFLRLRHDQGVKLYLDNRLVPHLVSMTAPVHPEVKRLFKWDNDFAWSYNGDVADSIKERVKKAGGKVEGVALRCSLAWYNYDDLDLHCMPPSREEIYYGRKQDVLDIDMNAHGQQSREAVENMRWTRLADGLYHFKVENFNRREVVDVGFTVEVEGATGLHTFRYDKAVGQKEGILVCTVTVHNGQVIAVTPGEKVVSGAASQEVWGLKTLDLAKVNAIVLSPNHWDSNAVGNKHWFFILEGCKNPVPCRGIYNEYLHPRLEQHRKVFEMLGSKTKCPVADEQLSGVGFSSTRHDKVIAVSGGVAYEISF